VAGAQPQRPIRNNSCLRFRTWNTRNVCVDATGICAGIAAFLQAARPTRGEPVIFTSVEKSRLGYEFLAATETGRFLLYPEDGNQERRDCVEQLQNTQYEFRANEIMSWSAAKAGHDDYVVSAALWARATTTVSAPAVGGIIRRQDANIADGDW
jgi:hypothetical protein